MQSEKWPRNGIPHGEKKKGKEKFDERFFAMRRWEYYLVLMLINHILKQRIWSESHQKWILIPHQHTLLDNLIRCLLAFIITIISSLMPLLSFSWNCQLCLFFFFFFFMFIIVLSRYIEPPFIFFSYSSFANYIRFHTFIPFPFSNTRFW